jgi:uncharacterized damage-inducible protein DinB
VFAQNVSVILRRDLATLRRELAAYPDDASVWRVMPGTRNSAGALALHLAGNLRHFVGSVLGETGYVRDRDAEFSRRDLPRAELIAELERAEADVERTLNGLSADRLFADFPSPIGDHTVRTDDFLLHLVSHLGYHLGQVDYHRRLLTGESGEMNAVSPRQLGSARPVRV